MLNLQINAYCKAIISPIDIFEYNKVIILSIEFSIEDKMILNLSFEFVYKYRYLTFV